MQPLVVRLLDAAELKADQKRGEPGGSFVLIAGERRWRAAQRAGLKEVPVVVKDVSAAQAFELALVENLQREDLNAIEEAEAYRRLSDEFGYTQEELVSEWPRSPWSTPSAASRSATGRGSGRPRLKRATNSEAADCRRRSRRTC